MINSLHVNHEYMCVFLTMVFKTLVSLSSINKFFYDDACIWNLVRRQTSLLFSSLFLSLCVKQMFSTSFLVSRRDQQESFHTKKCAHTYSRNLYPYLSRSLVTFCLLAAVFFGTGKKSSFFCACTHILFCIFHC